MHSVDSSSIRAIGYDAHRRQLWIEYCQSGWLYAYLGVPPRVFAALERAPSKGRFVNAVIKPRYRYQRVRPKPAATRRP